MEGGANVPRQLARMHGNSLYRPMTVHRTSGRSAQATWQQKRCTFVVALSQHACNNHEASRVVVNDKHSEAYWERLRSPAAVLHEAGLRCCGFHTGLGHAQGGGGKTGDDSNLCVDLRLMQPRQRRCSVRQCHIPGTSSQLSCGTRSRKATITASQYRTSGPREFDCLLQWRKRNAYRTRFRRPYALYLRALNTAKLLLQPAVGSISR